MIARTLMHRTAEVAGFLLPAVTLALVPKCPMCIAGYVAVATGLGISFSVAGWIRTGIIGGSIALLIVLAVRRGIRWWRRTEPSNNELPRCCR